MFSRLSCRLDGSELVRPGQNSTERTRHLSQLRERLRLDYLPLIDIQLSPSVALTSRRLTSIDSWYAREAYSYQHPAKMGWLDPHR